MGHDLNRSARRTHRPVRDGLWVCVAVPEVAGLDRPCHLHWGCLARYDGYIRRRRLQPGRTGRMSIVSSRLY